MSQGNPKYVRQTFKALFGGFECLQKIRCLMFTDFPFLETLSVLQKSAHLVQIPFDQIFGSVRLVFLSLHLFVCSIPLSLYFSLSPSLPLSLSLFLSLSCFSDRITFAIAGNQFRGSFLPNDRLGRRLGYLDIALLSDRKFSILLLKPSCLSEVAVDSQHSVNGLLQEPFKDLDTTLSIATKS